MSRETIRYPNAGRRVTAILTLGLLFTMLAGCPPHNPTPVAGPAAGSRDRTSSCKPVPSEALTLLQWPAAFVGRMPTPPSHP
jgi:hypothetical protein